MNDRHWNDICYHFLISIDGDIIQGRDIKYISSPHKEFDKKYNIINTQDLDGVISICLLGNFEDEVIEKKQHEAWIMLLKGLMKEYNIDRKNIFMQKLSKL